jgi:hypothetical protein
VRFRRNLDTAVAGTQASPRVAGPCFVMGEAAGVAAAMMQGSSVAASFYMAIFQW